MTASELYWDLQYKSVGALAVLLVLRFPEAGLFYFRDSDPMQILNEALVLSAEPIGILRFVTAKSGRLKIEAKAMLNDPVKRDILEGIIESVW